MRRIGDNKLGQQMTLGTIIAIVLGIAVLVFLIFGFKTGWDNMRDKVTNYGGGSANLVTIKQSCDIACSSDDKYGFCNSKKNVKFGEKVKVNEYCNKTTTTADRNNCYATCNSLSKITDVPEVQAIRVLPCPSISCQ